MKTKNVEAHSVGSNFYKSVLREAGVRKRERQLIYKMEKERRVWCVHM